MSFIRFADIDGICTIWYNVNVLDSQFQLNCCGATGPLDYRHSAWYNRTRYVDLVWVPASCCLGAGLPVTGSQSGGAVNGPPYVSYQLHHRHEFQPPGPSPQYQQHYKYPLSPAYQSSQKPPVALPSGEKDDSRLLGGQDNLCQVEATLLPEHPSPGLMLGRSHNLKMQVWQFLTKVPRCGICTEYYYGIIEVLF